MKKEEVALIVFKLTADGEEAINMKVYKNGTIARQGAGGIPEIGISGMSLFDSSAIFDTLIAQVPQEILETPVNYEEDTPNGYLEYVMACYGDSTNNDTGENAQWAKSTGIRIRLDHETNYNDPIVGFLDRLMSAAAELTNEWYFDIMVLAKYKMLSSALPAQTIVTLPKTETAIHTGYADYIDMMLTSLRQWSMAGFDKDKTYEREGKSYAGYTQQDEQSFSINFIELEDNPTQSHSNSPNQNESAKKPWWKKW